ncbi:MAG: hypothetical protein ACREBE_13920 [bacterium]
MSLYQNYATNRQAEEEGKWTADGEFRGKLRIKIRSMQSKVVRAAQERINERNRKYFRTGTPIPANVQTKNEIEIAVAVTADWENATDAKDEPLAFSADAAKQVYTDLWELRQQVIGLANQADTFRERDDAEAEKN